MSYDVLYMGFCHRTQGFRSQGSVHISLNQGFSLDLPICGTPRASLDLPICGTPRASLDLLMRHAEGWSRLTYAAHRGLVSTYLCGTPRATPDLFMRHAEIKELINTIKKKESRRSHVTMIS